MKKNNYIVIALLLSVTAFSFGGCKKYLEAKPNQALAVPTSVQDLQALLDAYFRVNNDPGSSEASADNYYLTYADWSSLTEPYRGLYTWEKDHVFANYPNDWSQIYNTVFITNVVLDNIDKIDKNIGNTTDWNNAKGSALLLRS
ncbi:MAG: RagB/SusD family nutrient uptake outer membrane protein, partial [Bacteroidota bacterium]